MTIPKRLMQPDKIGFKNHITRVKNGGFFPCFYPQSSPYIQVSRVESPLLIFWSPLPLSMLFDYGNCL